MVTPQDFVLPCKKTIVLENRRFIFFQYLPRSVFLGETQTSPAGMLEFLKYSITLTSFQKALVSLALFDKKLTLSLNIRYLII